MKITQLMLAKGFGGAERLFVDLVSELSNRGNDVLAICQPGSESEKILINNPDIKINTVRAFSTRDPFAWRAIASKIQKHDSDIVQSHLSRGTYLAGKACFQLGKPLVVTLHNYIDLKYYQQVTQFIPSTIDLSKYLANNGIRKDRIKILPHFSTMTAVDEPPGIKNTPPVLASFGRMVDIKGHAFLLDSFRQLLNRGVKARLVIGGDGPERKKLLKQCKDLELENHVIFEGWVNDVRAFLSKADFFILPSLKEAFGIVLLEAMAMGVPIISTLTKGPKELLNDNIAYMADIGNVEELSDQMNIAISEPEESREKARKALEKFRYQYSKDVVVPTFVDLYREVIFLYQNKGHQ